MKTQQDSIESLRDRVRDHYTQVVERRSGCGCSTTCCTTEEESGNPPADPNVVSRALGYSREDTQNVPQDSNLALGCGNPQSIAELWPGETVLDLGSGAGFDVFLASRVVRPGGRVIGVDMTHQMISKARANRSKGNYDNVEFRLGEIEALPVADEAVDVIISNCVINLSPEKERVLREAFRVLKPGGRLAISDIVALAPIPEELRPEFELYTGCVAGAALVDDLRRMLADAGFEMVRILPNQKSSKLLQNWFPGRNVQNYVASATIQAVKPVAQ